MATQKHSRRVTRTRTSTSRSKSSRPARSRTSSPARASKLAPARQPSTTERRPSSIAPIEGIGLISGVELDLNPIMDAIRQCKSALSEASGRGQRAFSEGFSTLQEQVGPLKKAAQEGSPKAKEVYNDLVSTLKDAAVKGRQQAEQLLDDLGVELDIEELVDTEM